MARSIKRDIRESVGRIESRMQTMPKGSPQYVNAANRLDKKQALLQPRPSAAPMARPQMPAQAAPQAQPMQRPLPQKPIGLPQPTQVQPQMPMQQPEQVAQAPLGIPNRGNLEPTQQMPLSQQRPDLNPQFTNQVFGKLQGAPQPQEQPMQSPLGMPQGGINPATENPFSSPLGGGGIVPPMGMPKATQAPIGRQQTSLVRR
jgi:hypothetical protein